MQRLAFLRMMARQRRAFDAEAVELRDRLVASIARHGKGRESFGPIERALVLRDLDRILDDYYGRYPGDEQGKLWRLILDQCRLARRGRFLASWLLARDILRQRAPDVLRALQRRERDQGR